MRLIGFVEITSVMAQWKTAKNTVNATTARSAIKMTVDRFCAKHEHCKTCGEMVNYTVILGKITPYCHRCKKPLKNTEIITK